MYCPSCGTLIPQDAKFCAQCGKPAPQSEAAASAPKPLEPPSPIAQSTIPIPSAEGFAPERPTTEPTRIANTTKAGIGRFIATAVAIIGLLFGLLMMIAAPIGGVLKLCALIVELGLAFAVWKRSRTSSRTLFVAVCVCTVLFFVLLGLGVSQRKGYIRPEDPSNTSKQEDPLEQVAQGGLHLTPQHPEDLVGKWKGTGPDISLTVDVTFTDEGQFQMLKGRPEVVGTWIHGPYTVDNSSWPMKITVVDGDRERYFAVAIREQDKMDLEEIDSPDDPLNADNASQLLRLH